MYIREPLFEPETQFSLFIVTVRRLEQQRQSKGVEISSIQKIDVLMAAKFDC